MINIKPNLIGIAGDPQVGKNTVGKIILYLTYVEQKEKEGINSIVSYNKLANLFILITIILIFNYFLFFI